MTQIPKEEEEVKEPQTQVPKEEEEIDDEETKTLQLEKSVYNNELNVISSLIWFNNALICVCGDQIEKGDVFVLDSNNYTTIKKKEGIHFSFAYCAILLENNCFLIAYQFLGLYFVYSIFTVCYCFVRSLFRLRMK